MLSVVINTDPPSTCPDLLIPLAGSSFTSSDERDSLLWVRMSVPADAAPGTYHGRVNFRTEKGKTGYCPVTVRVHDVTLPDVGDGQTLMGVWQTWTPLAQQYGVKTFSDEWWTLIDAYLKHLADMDIRTVQVGRAYFDWKRVAAGQWQFEFSRFDRYVKLCEKAGLTGRIDYLGMMDNTGPTLLYYLDSEGKLVSVEAEPGSEQYDDAWSSFTGALARHCREMGWFDRLCVWPADRPATDDQIAAFRHAAELLRAADPDYTVGATFDKPEPAEKLADCTDLFAFPLDEDMGGFASLTEQLRAAGKQVGGHLTEDREQPGFSLDGNPARAYAAWPVCLMAGLDGIIGTRYPAWDAPIDIDAPVVGPGFGGLVYPGEQGPLGSLRAERLLLGMQDAILLRMVGREISEQWWREFGVADDWRKLEECAQQLRRRALLAATQSCGAQ